MIFYHIFSPIVLGHPLFLPYRFYRCTSTLTFPCNRPCFQVTKVPATVAQTTAMPPHQVIQQVSQQPIAGPQPGAPPQMIQGKQRNDSMSSESSYTVSQQYHHQQQRHSLTQMQVHVIRYSVYFSVLLLVLVLCCYIPFVVCFTIQLPGWVARSDASLQPHAKG